MSETIAAEYDVLLSTIADELKKSPRYVLELDNAKAGQVMKAVMGKALQAAKDAGVEATVMKSSVNIANKRGEVKGQIFVNHPLLKDNISIECSLGNVVKDKQETLGLDKLKVSAGSFAGKIALGTLGVENTVKAVLENPVKALGDALSPELKSKGVLLSGVGAKFTDRNTLQVTLVRK